MKSFSALLIAVACLLPTLSLAATVTLNPTADAYVQDGKSASKNYGSKTQLRVQTNATAASNYDSYLKFDTSAATGEIASAKLRLYVPLSKADSVSTSVHAVGNTGWGETTLTWNNRPALGAALGSVAVNSTDYAWKEIDVTAYVQAEKAAGRSLLSLGLHNASTSSAYVRVNSRNAHSNRPELVIVTAPAANLPPSVSLTAPVAGSSYTAPASVTLTASAADSDGMIASVAFYNGATLIGTGTFSGGSYTFTWSNIAAGSYNLTARATDNLGAVTDSAPVAVTVTDPVPPPVAAGVYYVYADHLNTPRVITDGSNKVVWRWDSGPFGTDAANEDPDGDGQKFSYNLRFPGQYYDRETGLHYNYFRDYDPTTGRYIEADPIGLEGGLNTYGYADGNPLSYVDPLGLWVKRCARGLGDKDKLPKKPSANPVRHDYLSVSGQILSFQAGGNPVLSQGFVDNNNEYPSNPKCNMVCDDDKFDRYVIEAAKEVGEPTYCLIAYPGNLPHMLGARNCQTWANDVLKKAKKKYLAKESCPKCFK